MRMVDLGPTDVIYLQRPAYPEALHVQTQWINQDID